MPILPLFLGIKFKLWEMIMEGLLDLIDLWQFAEETSINPQDKSGGAITLLLIILTLDENFLSSILHEFGEVCDAKMFLDILEMKYNMKWSEKVEVDESVLENDDCSFSLITDCETEDGNIEAAMMDDECVPVIDIETCDDEETTIDVESEYFYEVFLM